MAVSLVVCVYIHASRGSELFTRPAKACRLLCQVDFLGLGLSLRLSDQDSDSLTQE